MDPEYSDEWAVAYEDHVADMFAVREHAQLELTDSLERADLFGASMASFKHAMASAELGDGREAQVHLFLAAVLAEADVQMAAEDIQEDLDEIVLPTTISFQIPWCVDYEIPKHIHANKQLHRYRHAKRMDNEELYEARAIRDEVKPAIERAEIAVNSDTLPSHEVNQAIKEAVSATVNLIFVKSLEHQDRERLLVAACNMASSMNYQSDYETNKVAFEIYEQIALGAIITQGKTMPALTQALGAFKEISNGKLVPSDRKRSLEYIDMLNKARAFKMAFNAMMPMLALWDAHRPYVEGSNDYWSTTSRASRGLQRTARTIHAQGINDKNHTVEPVAA